MTKTQNTEDQALRAWDPFTVARNLMRWEPFAAPAMPARSGFVPTFDITETDESYVLSADIPGVDEDDLDVTVAGNQLSIRGNRTMQRTQEGDTYHVHERAYGTFQRTFTMPNEADLDRVDGGLEDGVLRLTIPKRQEARPRKISLAQRIKNKLKA